METQQRKPWQENHDMTWPSITQPETNISPENGWLEYDRFLLGLPIFRGERLVFRGVYTSNELKKNVDPVA